MNCLHSFKTESKLKSHENLCKNQDYCKVKRPGTYNKILLFNQAQKSTKIPFVNSAKTKSLLEKHIIHTLFFSQQRKQTCFLRR